MFFASRFSISVLIISLITIVLISGPSNALATTYIISPDGNGDYPNIQTGINAAGSGDIIELTDGTFTGDGNRELDYLGKSLTVRSQSGDPATCIIDGEWEGFGFTFQAGEGAASVLEGIKLTKFAVGGRGGAISCIGASPTITNCVISGCDAYRGGGIFCHNASPLFTNCSVSSCDGIYAGGGVYCETGSAAVFSYCVIAHNLSDEKGGGLFASNSDVELDHCTLEANSCQYGDGIVYADSGSVTLTNTIISNSNYGPAVACAGTGTVTLTCCDLYGNAGGDWTGCIAGQYGQDGNISANPRFCNVLNYSLHHTSPCAVENNPGCGQIGALPVGCGTEVYVVNPEGTGDFPDIQTALDMVWDGDIIELTDGTFTGENNRNLNYTGKAVTVRSQNSDPTTCIIDGEWEGFGFTFQTGEGAASVLEGIMLTKFAVGGRGGAISCIGASPTITNCVISGCDAYRGGGIFCHSASPLFTNCSVSGCDGIYAGGGVYCETGSAAVFSYCVIAHNLSDEKGGGLFTSNSDVELDHCTLEANSCQYGDGIVYADSGSITLTNTIISNSNYGPAVACVGTGTVTLACCDLYGNAGGDWTGCIAGQYGQDGNISEDPLYCPSGFDQYTLMYDSPCAEENNPTCGQIGARGIGCGFRIISIEDVANDQGRRVRLSWSASLEDVPGSEYTITQYNIWRRIDELPDMPRTFPPGDWDFVKSVPAHGESVYNTICETLCDSTIVNGACWSVFFVRAATDDPFEYFDCDPDSGYSLDNLPPAVPLNLFFSEPNLLAWDEAVESDFAYYTVYGSDTDVLNETATLIGYTLDPTYDLTSDPFGYYHVTTTDYNGNEGDDASIEGVAMSAPEDQLSPTKISIYEAQPNPFRNGTSIGFDLQGAIDIRLTIFDATGRQVRVVRQGQLPAGRYQAFWDGTDDLGIRVAPGIYFARMEAKGFEKSRKLVLIR
jgi:FlgD Ig-like domain